MKFQIYSQNALCIIFSTLLICKWYITLCKFKLYNLTEAEDIQKRWQEYTEELYKKDLHDPDNHDGVITHLELDILECEVKWALGSITMNTSGWWNSSWAISNSKRWCCESHCTQYASKSGKLSSGHRTGKCQFSF